MRIALSHGIWVVLVAGVLPLRADETGVFSHHQVIIHTSVSGKCGTGRTREFTVSDRNTTLSAASGDTACPNYYAIEVADIILSASAQTVVVIPGSFAGE